MHVWGGKNGGFGDQGGKDADGGRIPTLCVGIRNMEKSNNPKTIKCGFW